MNILKSLFAASGESLDAMSAQARIDSDQPLMILDVRQPAEFQSGHIPGAKLIPLHELRDRIDELPKDKEILCVCRSGSRSGAAVRQLSNAGYNAINLRGGMIGWQRNGYAIKTGR